MAQTPQPELRFVPGCCDCGQRDVTLPQPLPAVGDDFDWLVRDYDGFRLFMMEQLAARFPERRRWTPADMEVVIVEAVAVVLDQLSDTLDRVHAEAFLETARRPESVMRLLAMIGYDAAQAAGFPDLDDPAKRKEAAFELAKRWANQPLLMEEARSAGPRHIRTQKRMVTEGDYGVRLQDHPLVARAHASSRWTGSWLTIDAALITVELIPLDDPLTVSALGNQEAVDQLSQRIDIFNLERGLDVPQWAVDPTLRTVIQPYVEAYRMAGQEVFLRDAQLVGVNIAMSIRVAENYYQSEISQSVREALGTGIGGFFEPGRLTFGEDLFASDLIEVVMALDGVEAVCLNRFKRVGNRYPDKSDAGWIALSGIEVAVCDNDPEKPGHGRLRLTFHGGRKG